MHEQNRYGNETQTDEAQKDEKPTAETVNVDPNDPSKIAASSVAFVLVFELADRLSRNEVTDISGAMNQLVACHELPGRVRRNMRQLGTSLGRFDLEGQLQGLDAAKQQCRKDLIELQENAPQRIRNYQTLALCAGAALAILFF